VGNSTALPIGKAATIAMPNLVGQSVRNVIEACSRLGLDPSLIGEGVVLQQFPDAGTQVQSGSRITVRFGRAAQLIPASSHGVAN
jgi:beta-lactam-binding protein with PASTA domain